MTAAILTPLHRPWVRRWILGLFWSAGVVLLFWFTRTTWLVALAQYLDVSKEVAPADAAMVLGGGSQIRPYAAAALFRRRLVSVILVPQVKPSVENERGFGKSEGQIIREVLAKQHVPESAIVVLEDEVSSTIQEAEALKRYLDTHPDHTVIVVTHAFHTRRTRLLFRRTLGDRVGSLRFVGVPTERFDATNWWRSEEGFTTYFNEFLKLGMYALRYDRLLQAIVVLVLPLTLGVWIILLRRRAHHESDTAL